MTPAAATDRTDHRTDVGQRRYQLTDEGYAALRDAEVADNIAAALAAVNATLARHRAAMWRRTHPRGQRG